MVDNVFCFCYKYINETENSFNEFPLMINNIVNVVDEVLTLGNVTLKNKTHQIFDTFTLYSSQNKILLDSVKEGFSRISTAVVQRFCKPKVGSSNLSSGTRMINKLYVYFNMRTLYRKRSIFILWMMH